MALRFPTDEHTVGFWKLEETSAPFLNYGGAGSALNFVSTRGTVYTRQNGRFGYCIRCYDSGVYTADTTAGESSALTISAWVLVTEYREWSNFLYKEYYRVAQSWNSPYLSVGMSLYNTYDGRWRIGCAMGGGYIGLNASTMRISANNWVHVGAVINATGGADSFIKAYQNGSLVATWTGTLTLDWGQHGPWSIGTHTKGGDRLRGYIEDVRVYNTVRDNEWFAAYYAATAREGGDAWVQRPLFIPESED